jgi:hypothetical protein
MIKNYFGFIAEKFDGPRFKYYCFDVDDNLLFMKTKIHLDKLENGEWVPYDVSTAEYALIRNDKVNYRIEMIIQEKYIMNLEIMDLVVQKHFFMMQ